MARYLADVPFMLPGFLDREALRYFFEYFVGYDFHKNLNLRIEKAAHWLSVNARRGLVLNPSESKWIIPNHSFETARPDYPKSGTSGFFIVKTAGAVEPNTPATVPSSCFLISLSAFS